MDERDMVFHGLAIKRHTAQAAIAELMGLPSARVESQLAQAVATGRAIEANGAFALSALGKLALEARYAKYFGTLRSNSQFKTAYEGFERINRTLKQVITDWQTMTVRGTHVANDHSDRAYDEKIIDRLSNVHDQVEPILKTLAGDLPRLAIYSKKLLYALEAAEEGDFEWVSDIRRDSYHTVWFELHEDLLRIMGQIREE
jgi:hypothetical protein